MLSSLIILVVTLPAIFAGSRQNSYGAPPPNLRGPAPAPSRPTFGYNSRNSPPSSPAPSNQQYYNAAFAILKLAGSDNYDRQKPGNNNRGNQQGANYGRSKAGGGYGNNDDGYSPPQPVPWQSEAIPLDQAIPDFNEVTSRGASAYGNQKQQQQNDYGPAPPRQQNSYDKPPQQDNYGPAAPPQQNSYDKPGKTSYEAIPLGSSSRKPAQNPYDKPIPITNDYGPAPPPQQNSYDKPGKTSYEAIPLGSSSRKPAQNPYDKPIPITNDYGPAPPPQRNSYDKPPAPQQQTSYAVEEEITDSYSAPAPPKYNGPTTYVTETETYIPDKVKPEDSYSYAPKVPEPEPEPEPESEPAPIEISYDIEPTESYGPEQITETYGEDSFDIHENWDKLIEAEHYPEPLPLPLPEPVSVPEAIIVHHKPTVVERVVIREKPIMIYGHQTHHSKKQRNAKQKRAHRRRALHAKYAMMKPRPMFTKPIPSMPAPQMPAIPCCGARTINSGFSNPFANHGFRPDGYRKKSAV